MIKTELIIGYKWTKRISYFVFLFCSILICYTTIFFKEEFICLCTGVWWYEPEVGFIGKNLKGGGFTLLIMLLNVLPFYQWKGYTWRLPIYDFGTKWLHWIYTPISLCHWVYYLLVVPFFIWFIYSPFDVTTHEYAQNVKIMYGYHDDDNVLNTVFMNITFFLVSLWIIIHEIIFLIRNVIINRKSYKVFKSKDMV